MRKLKFHEKKLLKKVDFLQWKSDRTARESAVLKQYMIQDRQDYVKYNRLAGQVTQMSKKLLGLPPHSRVRIELTDKLLDKLFLMGVINSKRSLVAVEKLTSAAFARRRLPVVLVRMKFCETLKQATQFIQQGHIRVGPEVVTDPAFFVTRSMEDFITWVDGSKVKRTVAKYNDKLDDFDLLGE